MQKSRRVILILLCSIALILMLYNPKTYIESTKNGLIIFTASVLPSIFPFFFFSSLLTKLGAANGLAKIFKKPFQKIYNAPPISSYVFCMSLMCGYPIGAKIISDLYSSNLIAVEDAKKTASFSSTSGPLFVLGTLGTTILNDYHLAVCILIAHYMSAMINGLLYRGKKTKNNIANLPLDADDILTKTIANSTMSMLNICGYIVVFNLIIDLMLNTGLINFLTSTLSPNGKEIAKGIVCGIIEMTRGTIYISKANLAIYLKCGVLSSIVSFSGLGIFFQSMSFLDKCNIKTKTILLQKFTQSIIALLIGTLLGFFLLFKQ